MSVSLSAIIRLCCSLYCLVCSRYDKPKCHYLLNLEYEPCDILLSIVHDKKFDSHHNTAYCHVCCFCCRYGTLKCIQLAVFDKFPSSCMFWSCILPFLFCFFMSPFLHFLFLFFCILEKTCRINHLYFSDVYASGCHSVCLLPSHLGV